MYTLPGAVETEKKSTVLMKTRIEPGAQRTYKTDYSDK